MNRRIDIHIGRVVVDKGLDLDQRTLAAVLERQLTTHISKPGTAGAIAPRNTTSVDGGKIGGNLANSLGRRIATVIAPRGGNR
jgi:hypothetical protein